MFFDSRDDISETLFDLCFEFEKSEQKKFAIQHLKSYDELSYEIVQRYIPKFNRWIKERSNNQAEVITKRTHIAKTRRDRDMFTDSDREQTDYENLWEIYLIWTGVLPDTF
jgi:exoribonuclease II